MQELLHHVRPEGEGDAALVVAPPRDVFVWVRPEQVAKQSCTGAAWGSLALFPTGVGVAGTQRRAQLACSAVQERTGVWDVRWAHDAADLLHRVEVRREPAVHAKNLLVDDRRDRQAVERVRERLPDLDVVAPLALVVEPVDAIDRRAFVVPPENKKVLGVPARAARSAAAPAAPNHLVHGHRTLWQGRGRT